jgi:hypothetical protein
VQFQEEGAGEAEGAVMVMSATSMDFCAYCAKPRELRNSHAIPDATFKAARASGKGQLIGIPNELGKIAYTQDTGAAPMLCHECESAFNVNFDSPISNFLKRLENAYLDDGPNASLQFDANELAKALVSIGWRICRSRAEFYGDANLSTRHLYELDNILRSPNPSVLKKCTIRLSRLYDSKRKGANGFADEIMKQFIINPKCYTVSMKKRGATKRFALEWTMFGFLVHLIVPRLTYPSSRSFGGLKANSKDVAFSMQCVLEYEPIMSRLAAGYAAIEQGRVSKKLAKRKLSA